MTSRKHILWVIFAAAVALCCGLISGCGEYSDSLQRILAEDRMVFGIQPENSPLSFKTGGEPNGMSVDIGNELAARLNVEAEFVFVSTSDVQSALDSGLIDVYVNLPSPGQKETATMLTVETGIDYRHIMVVPANSKISRLYDLKGDRLSVISSSDSAGALDEAVVFKGDLGQILWCSNPWDQMSSLDSGKADAMLIHEPMYLYMAKDFGEKYKALDEVLSSTGLVLALRQQDGQLASRVKTLLSDMHSDGTFEQIRSKWLGQA